jgi:hypothetical protein
MARGDDEGLVPRLAPGVGASDATPAAGGTEGPAEPPGAGVMEGVTDGSRGTDGIRDSARPPAVDGLGAEGSTAGAAGGGAAGSERSEIQASAATAAAARARVAPRLMGRGPLYIAAALMSA